MSVINRYGQSGDFLQARLNLYAKRYGKLSLDECCLLYAQASDYLKQLPPFDPAVRKFYEDQAMAKQYGTFLKDLEEPNFSNRVVELRNDIPYLRSEGMAGNDIIIDMVCEYMKMERQEVNGFPGYLGQRLVVLKPVGLFDYHEYHKYEKEFGIRTYGFVDPRLSLWPVKI